MKNHQQMCGLAVALDYVGDRWTLLIVRELLVAPRTFSELQCYLPGCSPNLLVSRLKEMTGHGLVIQKQESSTRRGYYQLTETGMDLKGAIESLVLWGGGFVPKQRGLTEKRPHWLEIAVPALLRPKLKLETRFRIQFLIDAYEFGVIANGFEMDVIKGKVSSPDLDLKLPYEKLLGLLSGHLPLRLLDRDEISSKRYPTKAAAIGKLREILA